MSNELDLLEQILSEKLPVEQVKSLISRLTIASGDGSVAITEGAAGAVIITGDKNIIGDNNVFMINPEVDGEEIVRTLRKLLNSQKVSNQFRSLIEDKTEGFVGHEYVFDAVQSFMDKNPKGYFTIISDPGMAKLKAILQEKLSDDEVERILAELVVVSGGSVLIGGDATEAVINTGDKNIIGDNNQVIINHGTDAETMRDLLNLIVKNTKAANSSIASHKNRTVQGKNTAIAVKPPMVKKSTSNPKKSNTIQISKNINILSNSRINVPAKLTALKELSRDAKGDNSTILLILSLIQKRNENNDLIAAGITALSKISDGRACIVTTIISVLRFNQSRSVVISAMNAFGKIANNHSSAADKMLDLLSDGNNTIEMKESIIRNLGKSANGNKKVIHQLISILNSTKDLIKTRKLTADSLVQIAIGDPNTSLSMGNLLTDRKLSTSFKNHIARSLKKIDPSNPKIAAYLKTTTKNKYFT